MPVLQRLSLGLLFLGLCTAGLIPNFGPESDEASLPSLPGLSLFGKLPFFNTLPRMANIVSHAFSEILKIAFDDISGINIHNEENCAEAKEKLLEVKEVLKQAENLHESNPHHAKVLEMIDMLEKQMGKAKHFCPELTTLFEIVLESVQNLKKDEHVKEAEEKVEDNPEPEAEANAEE